MERNQVLAGEIKAHGGARHGAGRKSIEYHVRNDARYLASMGINPLYADEILARVIDERKTWQRILRSPDDRVVLQAMMFLVSMRDGRPAQRINVTSSNVNINVSDVERARAIAAEFRSAFALEDKANTAQVIEAGDSVREVFAVEGKAKPRLGTGEGEANDIMVSGDEGGKKDGEDR